MPEAIHEPGRVVCNDIGDARGGRREIGVIGLLDVAHEAGIEPSNAGGAEESDALRRGHAADQTFAFDVAHQRRQEFGRCPNHLHGRGDEFSILGRARPLFAVAELLGHVRRFAGPRSNGSVMSASACSGGATSAASARCEKLPGEF